MQVFNARLVEPEGWIAAVGRKQVCRQRVDVDDEDERRQKSTNPWTVVERPVGRTQVRKSGGRVGPFDAGARVAT